jgi:hypothetical protein
VSRKERVPVKEDAVLFQAEDRLFVVALSAVSLLAHVEVPSPKVKSVSREPLDSLMPPTRHESFSEPYPTSEALSFRV